MSIPLVVVKGDATRPFVPYAAQQRILTDPSEIILAVGGVGFGKTATAAAWILSEAWRKPGKYLVGASSYPQLRGALWESLVEMAHPAVVRKELKSPQLELHLTNGSVIVGRTLSKPDALQGLELSGAAVDEAGVLPHAEAIRELLRRLRQQGDGKDRLYLSANPAGHNWLWELFVAPLSEIDDESARAEAEGIRQSLGVHRVTTFQNPFLYDDFPVCRRSSYISRLWKSLTPRARNRWLLGGFDDFSGEVYDAFNPDRHVVDMPAEWRGEWPAGWQLIQGVDFGFEDPWAALTVLIEPNARNPRRPTYWVVGEYYASRKPMQVHAARMVDLEGGRRLTQRYTDHEATIRHELQQRLREAGSSHPGCSIAVKGHLEVRIDLINRLLLQDRLKILKGAAPNLVRELQARDYDPKTKRPQDAQNHATDALEYAIYSYEETRSSGRLITAHR